MSHARPSSRLFAVVLSGLFGCGSDGPTGPQFSSSASQAETEDFANRAGYTATNLAHTLDFGFPSIWTDAPGPVARDLITSDRAATRARIMALQAGIPEGCSVIIRGVDVEGYPVDVDQNGIADDLYVRIECLTTDSTSSADTTWKFHTFQEVTTKEIFASLHGLTSSDVGWSRSENNVGGYETTESRMEAALDIRADRATDHETLTISGSRDWGQGAWKGSAGVELTGTFIPGVPIVRGGPLPSGALTYGGRSWTDNYYYPGVSLDFEMATTTPLLFTSGCAANAAPFSGGAIQGLLNGQADQASFLTTFPQCGTFQITTAGTDGLVE